MATTTTPQAGTTMARLDPSALARAATMLPVQRLVVSTQQPPAGRPLQKGATVEVTLIDLNSIPIIVFHPELPASMQNVTVGDATRIVEASPDLRTAIANPQATVTPAKAAELINAGGTGIVGKTLTADEAGKTLTALRSVSSLTAFRLP